MRIVVAFLCGWIIGAPVTARAGSLAIFRFPFGQVDVELFDASKPVTVSNFIHYARVAYTNNMLIHRWEPRFVIQGGGHYVSNRGQTNAVLKDFLPGPAITNEYSVGRRYSNLYGTIAMARRSRQTNSASSEWYFNLTNNTALDQVDGGFTVFGRVIRGTNVLERFNDPSTNRGIYWLFPPLDPPLNLLPVLALDPSYEDLVYVDVSVLTAEINKHATGQPEISWRSISNAVNRVEFTTNVPPVWKELTRTNGTGEILRVIDLETDASDRYYRVRVDY